MFSICDIEINDIYDIISILCALIILCVIIFIAPKFNKSLKFEKDFFNNKAVKCLIVILLLYCYLIIETPFFILITTLIFFIYWILNVNESFEIINNDTKEIIDNKNVINNDDLLVNKEFIDLQKTNLEKVIDESKQLDNPDSIIDLTEQEIFDQRDFLVINEQKDDFINYKQPFDYIAGFYDCKKPLSLPH